MEYENEYDPFRTEKIKVMGPLAMAYVPMQKFKNLYGPDESFMVGTIFKDLDFPWVGGNEN